MPYEPMTLQEFTSSFATQEACLDALIKRRWPNGWTCRKCGGTRSCRLQTRRSLQCLNPACRAQNSITQGTLFAHLKIPMPKVFLAIYLMTNKQGISAMSLSKHLGVAYDTAHNLLLKLRHGMFQRDRAYSLGGILQVDEAYVGGRRDRPHRKGRARDTKRVIGVAVEQRDSNVTGHIYLEVLPAADANSLHGMILEKVDQGSRLLTDDWTAYRGLGRKGFDHVPIKSAGGRKACSQWPLVHRAIANFKTWLLGTHKNFCQRYLSTYVAEYCWRTNRRNRTKRDYDNNLQEQYLPDRLLTLACQQPYSSPSSVRKARYAA